MNRFKLAAFFLASLLASVSQAMGDRSVAREVERTAHVHLGPKTTRGIPGGAALAEVKLVLVKYPHHYFLVYSNALAERLGAKSTVELKFSVQGEGYQLLAVDGWGLGPEVDYSGGHGCGVEEHLAPCDGADGSYRKRNPFR